MNNFKLHKKNLNYVFNTLISDAAILGLYYRIIPNRSLFNLQFCCKKLQQKLSKIFESLDFDVRLGLAKKKNPAFANLLQDMCDSTSSALVTTIPQVYGTLLSDSAWTLNMRFRSFIWPDNLPHN
ncbi:hypothetical protein P9112_009850 [Eukaryota sp. TZLM1-RC]